MRVLIVDNYDSFTYNLVQYLWELGAEVDVVLNDAVGPDELARFAADALLVSPGPGRPAESGITPAVVARWSGRLPLLGVCLGHQAIGEAFGARLVRARQLMHGKTSRITHTGHPLFAGIRSPFTATRYHSLALEETSLPPELEVTARSDDGEVMALAHRAHPTWGVQFHPESILTRPGKRILTNFLHLARRRPVPAGAAHRGADT